MSWRNHTTHREETNAVKQALAEARIPFTSVGHGKGTAWGWLEINVGKGNYSYHADATAIAKAVTGRSGDYEGQILILAQ